MLAFLKNHPFAVEAYFRSSLVLTFALPKEQIEKMIPECFQLDTYKAKWAFLAVALVETSGLRPKGFPKFLGNDFFLIGYRVFVRYTTRSGKRLRGLYILKSETDRRKMELLGNIFTHYNYSTTDISKTFISNKTKIISQKSHINIVIDNFESPVLTPENSPFMEWKEARKYAGPLPFTFTYNSKTNKVLIIEGVRQNWRPKPVKVLTYSLPFIDGLQLNNIVLANAFIINNIPYHWKKGRTDQWHK